MKEFNHFLITRFNIVQKWYGTADKNGNLTHTDEWLAERFRLFETYCFPSVRNQSCTDFVWFVLFNSETSTYYKQRIACYQAECPNFTPLFLEPYGDENELVKDAIYKIWKRTDYIITTRLDNDDALHRDFVGVVQSCFMKQKNSFINFIFGYQYDIQSKRLIKMYQQRNHYVSRISQIENNDFNLVLCSHTSIDTVGEIENIHNDIPLWLEVTHKHNVSNFFRNEKPVFDKNYKTYFNVKQSNPYFYYILNCLKYKIRMYSSLIFSNNRQ